MTTRASSKTTCQAVHSRASFLSRALRKKIMGLLQEYQDIDNLIFLDDDLKNAIKKAMSKKILASHKSKIWFDEGKQLHCTKLGGKNCTCKTLEGLQEKIMRFYKNEILFFRTVMIDQLNKSLSLKSIAQGTYDRYLSDYERYIKDSQLDKISVKEITSKQVRVFLEKQISNGISRKNFSNLISLLNVIYFYSELTDINVTHIKKLMRLKPRQFDKSNKRSAVDVVWTDEEQKKLLEYSHSHDDIRVFGLIFMMQTGLAISELTQLHRADINVESKELTVSRIEIKYKRGGKTVYDVSTEFSAKTETRLETILLSEKALQTYEKILCLTKSQSEIDCIFNGFFSYNFNNFLRRHVLVDLDLSPRGLHSLRKTYATNLIDAKVDLKIVQEQMRHSDIQTTTRYYYKSKSTKEKKLIILDQVG